MNMLILISSFCEPLLSTENVKGIGLVQVWKMLTYPFILEFYSVYHSKNFGVNIFNILVRNTERPTYGIGIKPGSLRDSDMKMHNHYY